MKIVKFLFPLSVTFVLFFIAYAGSKWLVDNWEDIFQFDGEFLTSPIKNFSQAQAYLIFIFAVVFLQEGLMIFFRFIIGAKGSRERIYIFWRDKKIGLHHAHWGFIIIFSAGVGLLFGLPFFSALFFLALGASCVLSDILHHAILYVIYGNIEGDANNKPRI
ncbi:MAG: hypothetical protein PHD51_03935 [Patescibacteria group bacterium]|nr:hypothetical protein [Patescibacteria group bacterium]MDD5490885.1 hypothetical protein [Patescibacteria group bacterium]